MDRFLSQGDTKRHLESLKEENSKQLARLKEDKVCHLLKLNKSY